MDKIIVYVDDAEYALHQLKPMTGGASDGPTHWVLVACPPRLARHISKWVNHTARRNWRNKWSADQFARLTPPLRGAGDKVTTVVAEGSLLDMTRQMREQHGAVRVLDARRPKFGQDLAPVSGDQPVGKDARWSVPGAVAGMGAFLVLASE